MTIEGYTDGKTLLFRASRRPTPPIGGLTPKQLAWCRSKWPWFEHNKVQRLDRTATQQETAR